MIFSFHSWVYPHTYIHDIESVVKLSENSTLDGKPFSKLHQERYGLVIHTIYSERKCYKMYVFSRFVYHSICICIIWTDLFMCVGVYSCVFVFENLMWKFLKALFTHTSTTVYICSLEHKRFTTQKEINIRMMA